MKHIKLITVTDLFIPDPVVTAIWNTNVSIDWFVDSLITLDRIKREITERWRRKPVVLGYGSMQRGRSEPGKYDLSTMGCYCPQNEFGLSTVYPLGRYNPYRQQEIVADIKHAIFDSKLNPVFRPMSDGTYELGLFEQKPALYGGYYDVQPPIPVPVKPSTITARWSSNHQYTPTDLSRAWIDYTIFTWMTTTNPDHRSIVQDYHDNGFFIGLPWAYNSTVTERGLFDDGTLATYRTDAPIPYKDLELVTTLNFLDQKGCESLMRAMFYLGEPKYYYRQLGSSNYWGVYRVLKPVTYIRKNEVAA